MTKISENVFIDKSLLKASTGQLRTKDVFLEASNWDWDTAVFTLGDEHRPNKKHPDRMVYSLYRLYMDMEDTTEWVFAETYLLGWKHWERFLKAPWFKPEIKRWRHELELKLQARHLEAIKEIANGDPNSKETIQACKYLLDRGYVGAPPTRGKTTTQKGPGRPKTETVEEESNKVSRSSTFEKEDAALILGHLKIN